MRTPETVGFEPATEQALGLLFVSAAAWLDNYGTLEVDRGNQVYGKGDDGLLIADSGPAFRFILNANVLRELLPEQAETLEVGGNVGLSYLPSHYSYVAGAEELLYISPTCQFRIPKADDPSRAETLYIELAIRNGFLLGIDDRYRESALPRTPAPGGTIEERWRLMTRDRFLQESLGLDRISHNECAALQSIVTHLGAIAERQVGQDQTEP